MWRRGRPLTPLADAAAVVLAAGTLSSLVTTPLWLRARHHAAVLGREATQLAAENLARAAETRHLIEVRVPAVLARLTFPHLPVPGPLHPQFTGSSLEADHLTLLDQVVALATAQAQPRRDQPATAADWFEPRHKAPGPARTAPYLSQPGTDPGPVPGWATRAPAPGFGPPPNEPVSPPTVSTQSVSPQFASPEPELPEPAPAAAGLRGSSAVWSAFQSGTDSGRVAAEHRFAEGRSAPEGHHGETHHAESHHEGSL
jgi:hypothetical protein